MASVSKLWRQSGKKVPFKEFLNDYNSQKKREEVSMHNMSGATVDPSAYGYEIPKTECDPVTRVKTIIIAKRVSSVDMGGILLYAGVGLAVGVLAGLVIKKL